jgi:serine phosphatase RsbU (regulator of sigma subunit)
MTGDFHEQLEAERGRRLKRRFVWYAGTVAGLNLLTLLPVLIGLVLLQFTSAAQFFPVRLPAIITGITVAVTVLMYLVGLRSVRKDNNRESVVSLATRLFVWAGVIALLSGVVMAELAALRGPPERMADITVNGDGQVQTTIPSPGDDTIAEGEQRRRVGGITIGAAGLFSIFFSHALLCGFLPLTVRESIRPLVPLLALNTLITFVYLWHSPLAMGFTLAVSPLIGLPGVAICYWRHSRFHQQFALEHLRGRYTEIRRELGDARRIHESLFPRAGTIGSLRLAYCYAPMSQIGGDYLYARFTPADVDRPFATPAFNLVLLDVTGHGLAAALTVNRLYGELERLYAEDPFAKPGDVLRDLNRYVNLTLSRHNIYVTALCIRIDQDRHTLHYASGGHPPAFLRTLSGELHRLESTAMILGAVPNAEYEAHEHELQFRPGDTLIAYTDGAIEAKNNQGRMLGIEGLQRVIVSTSRDGDAGGLSNALLRAVDEHRRGPAADDTLVVEITRLSVARPREPDDEEPRSRLTNLPERATSGRSTR